MARWEPDARGRLLRSALELFAEQGYEATTAAQIAERADLTKTTLFRLFADKREILFQGQPAMVSVVVAGIESADADLPALDLLRAGLIALSGAHVPEQQEIGRRIAQLVTSSRELQERTAFKRATITHALEGALTSRLGDQRLGGVLADLGVRAYYAGFAAWTDARRGEDLSVVVLAELAELAELIAAVDRTRTALPT